MLTSTLVELSLLVLAWMTVRHALLVSERARAQVENSNIELEHRVAERTEQLQSVNQSLEGEIAVRRQAEELLERLSDFADSSDDPSY